MNGAFVEGNWAYYGETRCNEVDLLCCKPYSLQFSTCHWPDLNLSRMCLTLWLYDSLWSNETAIFFTPPHLSVVSPFNETPGRSIFFNIVVLLWALLYTGLSGYSPMSWTHGCNTAQWTVIFLECYPPSRFYPSNCNKLCYFDVSCSTDHSHCTSNTSADKSWDLLFSRSPRVKRLTTPVLCWFTIFLWLPVNCISLATPPLT
jgi:hypothetical protein